MSNTCKTFLKKGLFFILPVFTLLLGNYMNISKSKYICYFLKLYCIVIAIFLLFCHIQLHGINNFNHIVSLEYLLYVIYHLITSQEYMTRFRTGVCTSDAVMGYKNLPYINSFVCVFAASAFAIRILLMILQLHSTSMTAKLMKISYETNYTIAWFVLYVFYTRMVLIRKCLMNNLIPINIVGKDEVNKSINVVRKCVGYYNNLLDYMSFMDHPLQIIVSTFRYFICVFVCRKIILILFSPLSLSLLQRINLY